MRMPDAPLRMTALGLGWGAGGLEQWVARESEQVGGGYGYGCDGCGFGAEDARAQGDVLPLVGGEKGHLVGCPATLGADGQGHVGKYV